MRYLLPILLLLLCPAVQAMTAGADSLIVTDSIAPDGWQDGGTARVSCLSDNSTGTRLGSSEDGAYQDSAGVGMQNTSLTNIDSVELHYRIQQDGFGDDTIRVDIIVGGTRTTGTKIKLGGSVNYSEVFQDVPGGSGWTQAQVNGLTIEVVSVELASALNTATIYWLYIELHEPAAGGGQIIMISGD